MKKILVVCTTDSMIWNFLIPHIKELEKQGYIVECACSITGEFYFELESLYQIKMNEICFQRSPYNLNNIKAYYQLTKLVKQKNFDIIFCHEPIGGVLGRIVGHKYKCKTIYIAHGFHFFKGAPLINWLLYYPVEKYLSRYTDVLITINQEDYKRAQAFYAKKVEYISGIGIDTEKIRNVIVDKKEKRTELGLTEENIVLLSVGELSKRKNHIVLIKALANIKNNKNIFYLIAGTGTLENYLKKECEKLGIEKQVKFLGFRKDIYELCKISDIYIFPSLQEGLPVALMEAMCCNLPIICSNIRGNNDLIKNGKNGFLVRNTIVEYADKIKFLIKNKKFYEKLQPENEDIVKEIDIKNIIERIKEIYRNINN